MLVSYCTELCNSKTLNISNTKYNMGLSEFKIVF